MTRAAISAGRQPGGFTAFIAGFTRSGIAPSRSRAGSAPLVLYAGPNALLSHTTAAWLWKIIETEPTRIHVSVPGRLPSLPEVRAHHPRELTPVRHHRFPVTSVTRTLLDLATMLTARQLRRALAEADFRGLLEPAELRAALGRGRPGSRLLQTALASHLPELAETLSALEERFLELCKRAALPQPEVNARVGRFTVDAVWRDQRVAVELDGAAAHGGWAAIKRDRQRELALRALGFSIVRYTWEQVTKRQTEVAEDVRTLLAASELSPGRSARL